MFDSYELVNSAFRITHFYITCENNLNSFIVGIKHGWIDTITAIGRQNIMRQICSEIKHGEDTQLCKNDVKFTDVCKYKCSL